MPRTAQRVWSWLLVGQPAEPGLLVRWLFLRALGAVALIACVSLWLQLEGLVGPRGIAPASETLDWRARSCPRGIGCGTCRPCAGLRIALETG